MEKYAIIPAGGVGRRAGAGLPKQFHDLLGIPVLWWSVRAFYAADPHTHIILVLHPDYQDLWAELHAALPAADRKIEFDVVPGGADRPDSVANGLTLVPDSPGAYVAVHDGARPCVSPDIVCRGWDAAVSHLAAIPVVPVSDSLRMLDADSTSHAVRRSDFVAVQTPQVFRADILKQAYAKRHLHDPSLLTDDASIVELNGTPISLFYGNPNNIKVTNPTDFDIATLILKTTIAH